MIITNRQLITPLIALVVSVFVASGGNIAKFIKCQCKVHDPITVQNVSCWTKPINRTYTLANVHAYATRPVDHLLVNLELSKKSGIYYRPFLVNVTEDFCAFFAKNKASAYLRILGAIFIPYSNLNHTCPYEGHIFIRNMPLFISQLPSIALIGEYRLNVLSFQPQQKFFTMEFFVEIRENYVGKGSLVGS